MIGPRPAVSLLPMTRPTTKTLFLPGAGASAAFWRPVADRLGPGGTLLHWPGLGNEAPDPAINGMDDLVALVLRHMDEPVNIVAQSMGGYVALRAALAAPAMVRRLVLAVTSGGVPVSDLGGSDWRADYRRNFPRAAHWIADPVPDLSEAIRSIRVPALLLWGDADPISPVAVGERLLSLLPHARLHVVPGADHDLAHDHAALVAGLIGSHLMDGMRTDQP
ncbi:MAG: alpha/beta fold hydrolase [Sphingobium sp.]